MTTQLDAAAHLAARASGTAGGSRSGRRRRRGARARSGGGELGAPDDPGAPIELERPRRAARPPRARSPRPAPPRIDDRGVERRHVRRRRAPPPARSTGARATRAASRRARSPRGASSSQPRRRASSRTSSPSVRPMAHRQVEGATNDSKPVASRLPSTTLAAERIGPVEHPHLAAGGDRRLGRPHRGGGVGVVARLPTSCRSIDQQIEAVERAPAAAAATPRSIAVERDDRRRRSTDRARARRDHVLLDAVEAVLGSEQRRAAGRPRSRRARRRSSTAGSRSSGCRMGEQRRSAGRRAATGSLEQTVEAGAITRRSVPVGHVAPRASSRRSGRRSWSRGAGR